MSNAPKALLTRAATFTTRAADDDGFTLEGYAAVFDSPTLIDSWEGRFEERIAPGAFAKTIQERTPVVQFDHGHDIATGSVPIAAIDDIREDKRGLFVAARMFDNPRVEPIRQAIAGGAIDGMSFRFRVVREEWDESGDTDVRTIREAELFELGPVVFPAYEQTTVGVRSRQALDALQDPEVRSELARILATGTDVKSLATNPDPVTDHSGSTDSDSQTTHSERQPRSRAQRDALAALHLH